MATQLLAHCEAARRRGDDFPTIWHSILRGHPLVRGLPTHQIQDGEAVIVVRLMNGQSLHSSLRGFWLA
ncbi:hypothetical protein [Terricaulis sp.]|uniref:hypothetical protein n=1 Tax=Terricaulis sp. TaxID=2768686 RepID=UPI003783EE5B